MHIFILNCFYLFKMIHLIRFNEVTRQHQNLIKNLIRKRLSHHIF